jgi:ribonuclease III
MKRERDTNPISVTESDERVEGAAQALGIDFHDPELLRLALIHRSYLNEFGFEADEEVANSNERLEFLGDAVLGMITGEFLYHRYPDLAEGQLTAYRTALVRTETLASWARHFHLDQFLYLGRGEMLNEGEVRERILAGAFEAVLAAMYLDQGLETPRSFMRRLLRADAERVISAGRETNYKGRLQELTQERDRITPTYRTLRVSGPAHDRTFEVEVLVQDDQIGIGRGSSKRAAQQQAARDALQRLTGKEGIDDHE